MRNGYNNETFGTDQHAAIDYLEDGKWALCIASNDTARAHSVDDVLDTDTDLNRLIMRSLGTWGVDPTELWISDCGSALVSYNLSGDPSELEID